MQGDSTESTSPTPAGAAKTKKTDPETKPTASPEAPSKPPSNNTQLGNQKLATFQTRHINILA
jgi:hypothetical protein